MKTYTPTEAYGDFPKSEAVEISPAYVRGTRIRASFTLPHHDTHDIHVLARGLVDGSLFAGCDIVSATIEQTSVVNITRKVKR